MRQFLAAENTLKIKKNAFHFMLKALFVLEVFQILSWGFGHVKKWLDKKVKVNFKIYDVIDWQQVIAMHMMSGISRSKGSQAMKFGQLMEDNTRNIFLQKSCRNEAERLAPDLLLFLKKFLYIISYCVNQEIRTILIFYERIKEKYFSSYILLTDQSSLPRCLHALRHWAICVIKLLACQSLMS